MPSHLPVEQRREELVKAALVLAEREGVAAVTVRAVAREAGVSTGVVHYCFDDMSALLIALSDTIVADLRAGGLVAPPTMDGRSTSLRAILRRATDGFWAVVHADRSHQLMTYEITVRALRDASLAPTAATQYETSHAVARDILQASAAAAGVRWTRSLADVSALCLATVDGIVLRWLVDGDTPAARRRLDMFTDLLTGLTRPSRTAHTQTAGA